MIILMNAYKQLVITVDTKLYQRESQVDNLIFLLPQTYNDLDLSKFTVTLKYVDQKSVSHSEILTLSDDLYKDTYLQYTVPVDSELTVYTGDITIQLTAVWVDSDTLKQYVLNTSELVITISPLSDYYALVTDDSLNAIDQALLSINAKIGALDTLLEQIDTNQVDDLALDDDNVLHVTANGVAIGDGVEIVSSYTDLDEEDDGIIDIDNAVDDGSTDTDVVSIIDL